MLPAALFGSVTPGSKVTIIPHGGVAARHKATVKMVDRVVDAASGTFVARVELPNAQFAIPGGVRCQADLEGVANPVAAARAARP